MAWRRPGNKPLSELMIVYWRIYASLGLNELNLSSTYKHLVMTHGSWSTLVQAAACCLSVPGHYLNWHHEWDPVTFTFGQFYKKVLSISIPIHEFEYHIFEFTPTSPRNQWGNHWCMSRGCGPLIILLHLVMAYFWRDINHLQGLFCVCDYAPSQWEMTLHCNVISHWLGAYTKWSLSFGRFNTILPYNIEAWTKWLSFCRQKFPMCFDYSLIFMTENSWILNIISVEYIGSLGFKWQSVIVVHIKAWCQRGNKPLPEAMKT